MNSTIAESHLDIAGAAAQIAECWRSGKQIVQFSTIYPDLSVDDAYQIAAIVRDLNQVAGITPIGRKIGFTNRQTWAHYEPMWGYLYDTSVVFIDDLDGGLYLKGLAEPRIEPEVVLKLGYAPTPGMTDQELISCIEWAACGFEIVRSIYPGWTFSDSDAIAAFGLHGTLAIGKMAAPNASAEWNNLADFTCRLFLDGELLHTGHAENVLGGPVKALSYLVDHLKSLEGHGPLEAGEIVTTGTLTAVPPAKAGQVWSMRITGIPLEPISLTLA